MFKKLVTNLPYSPGLIDQIGFYSRRLKQEEFTRRIGLIFGVLALLLNINVAIFGPEASVLASPDNDIINGGIYGTSAQQMQDHAINAMRSNPRTKAVFDYYGITEAAIRTTSIQNIFTGDTAYRSVGYKSIGRGAESCKTYNGVYFCERSMLSAYGGKQYNVRALVGFRSQLVGSSDPWFALLESCGNVVIRVGKGEDITLNKSLVSPTSQKVKPGDLVKFRLNLRSNNANGAAYPHIEDTIPEYMQYVDHTPKSFLPSATVSGRTLTLTSTAALWGVGGNQEQNIDVIFKVLASAPQGARLCNTAKGVSLGDTAVSTSNPCVTVETPQPIVTCGGLNILGGSGSDLTRSFEARVSGSDSISVRSYTFDYGDGTNDVVTTSLLTTKVEHTYSQPGNYTISVKIDTSAGVLEDASLCRKAITISSVPPPSTPQAYVSCTYLNLLSGGNDQKDAEFEGAASANNATIQSFSFDFGDGQTAQVANTSNNKATVSHTYETSGTYKAQVTANTSEGAVTNQTSCVQSVMIELTPCVYNPELPQGHPDCEAPEGTPHIVLRKLAQNLTQGIDDAHNTTASAGDNIVYTLQTENDGDATQDSYVVQEPMADVLEYADLVDYDGGTFNEETKIITWPAQDIAPGQVLSKTITVKVKSPIPNTPISASDSTSYDLRMENNYGNNVTIKLPGSTPKDIELVTKELPNTGPGANLAISTLFISVVSYFYFRNRLIGKELRLIKQDYTGGMA